MNVSAGKDVVERLAVRESMSDPRYFVGRDRLIGGLPCLSSNQRGPVWLFGAQRIGKSSIAKALERKAKDKGDLVIWVDLIDADRRTFNEWLSVILQRAREDADNFQLTDEQSENPRFGLEALAKYSNRQPVLLIFDEFDRMAMQMRLDEQAFLRKLSHNHYSFTYVFITRSDPVRIIEDVEEHSRLTGVCRQKCVPPLSRRAVKKLCRLAFKDLDVELPNYLADMIWERVGGISVAVTHLVCQVVCEYLYEDVPPEKHDIEHVFKSEKRALRPDLEGYWWDLHPHVRMVLLGETSKESSQAIEDKLYGAGLIDRRRRDVIRPQWLIDLGNELGVTSMGEGVEVQNVRLKRVKRLHSLMASINETLKLKTGREPFEQTTETLKWFPLSRESCSDSEFVAAVNHLYKVFFEGASKGSGDDRKFRFPDTLDEFYEGSRSNSNIVGHISWVRNHFDHDKNSPADHFKPNKNYKTIGELFEEYCGCASPRTELERLKLRDELVRRLADHLQRVDNKVRELDSSR
jgi:hypothetical protein